MLNEPVQEAGQGGGGGGGGGGVAEAGGGHMNYIQVTPQEKEAIERVKHLNFHLKNSVYLCADLYKQNIVCSVSQILLLKQAAAHVQLQNKVLI